MSGTNGRTDHVPCLSELLHSFGFVARFFCLSCTDGVKPCGRADALVEDSEIFGGLDIEAGKVFRPSIFAALSCLWSQANCRDVSRGWNFPGAWCGLGLNRTARFLVAQGQFIGDCIESTHAAAKLHDGNDKVTYGIDFGHEIFFGCFLAGDLHHLILDDIGQVKITKHDSKE